MNQDLIISYKSGKKGIVLHKGEQYFVLTIEEAGFIAQSLLNHLQVDIKLK